MSRSQIVERRVMVLHKFRSSILVLECVIVLSCVSCTLRQTGALPKEGDTIEQSWMIRGVALRSLALALTDWETCQNAPRFYFTNENQQNWYAPYMCWLYENHIIDFEEIPPTAQIAQGKLLCGEVKSILKSLNLLDVSNLYLQSSDDTVVSTDLWWMIYDEILKAFNQINHVKQEKLKIWGTPLNIVGANNWEAYTNRGTYHFEGLALDSYVDRQIVVLVRDNAIIRICSMEEQPVTYENVWISSCENNKATVLFAGVYRSFSYEGNEASIQGIADIQVKDGSILSIKGKNETITGRLLAVGEGFVQIKGYGEIALSEEVQIYDLSLGEDAVSTGDEENLVAGTNSLQFVLSDGICCAVLQQKEEAVQNIRVLICNDNWSSPYHQQICLTSSEAFSVTAGQETTLYKEGEIVVLDLNTAFPEDGTMLIEGTAGIQLLSVNRALGNPIYEGSIEISRREEGLLIVNELPLEIYLTYVVPSEMPARYGLEAAKVQAVCARSYAWKQMHSNSCASFGAHVDDSTNYQVYNNISRQEVSTQGVLETEGEVLTLNGEILTAYYFSTSCGSTTDMRSWGALDAGYTRSFLVSPLEENLDLANEEVFRSFIQNWNQEGWELGEDWYRWKCTITKTELSALVASRLGELMQTMPNALFCKDSVGNLRPLTSAELGEVETMVVTKRLSGGVVDEIEICGSLQTICIQHQTAIRTILGDAARLYENNTDNGASVSESSLFPSAFFCIDTEEDTFVIYGGGNGHGIGLTQNGAYRMAEAGMDYKSILQKFYVGVEVEIWLD